MALNFTGTTLSPKRGGNPLGRKLEGVRVATLKKGQNQITLGEDVMEALGITAEKVDGKLNATVTAGTDKFAGKLLVKLGEVQRQHHVLGAAHRARRQGRIQGVRRRERRGHPTADRPGGRRFGRPVGLIHPRLRS